MALVGNLSSLEKMKCNISLEVNDTGFDNDGLEEFIQTSIMNQTATTVISVIKAPLLNTNVPVAIIYLAVISLALGIGTFGNTMILLIASCYRGFNRIGKEFVVNLALADFCVSAIADPMCIIGVVKGKHFFDDKPWLCDFVASLCLTACFCAFMSLTMLSLNRFVYVCHNGIFDKIYGKKMNIFFCVTCWVTAFLCEFPNFIGWGGHFFDEKSHQCIWDRTSNFFYSFFVSVGLIGLPLVIMSICYILIFKHIWETKWNIFSLQNVYSTSIRKKVWIEIAKTSRTLFVIFMVYLICWTPYAILIIVDIEDRMSTELHLFVTLLAHLHSSANCIIFFICNGEFRRNVLRFLGCKAFTVAMDYDTKLSSSTPDTNGDCQQSGDKKVFKLHKLQAEKIKEKQPSNISEMLSVYTTNNRI